MPELPEVETIVRQLNKKVAGRKITDAWTDWPKMIKTHALKSFISDVRHRKILRAHRRAKYVIIDLSGGPVKSPRGNLGASKTLIIHQKISGHLLYGKWEIENNKPVAITEGPIKSDPQNRFIRFILYLDNGYMLGLSDLRRFGKVYLTDTDKIEKMTDIGKLGLEPLDKNFTLKKFKELLAKKRGVIKKVLMDQFVISGIGNIYSDEILWYAGVHPLKRVEKLNAKELAAIYKYIRFVLKKAVGALGDSEQDYRTLEGKMGSYQNKKKAYHLTGEKCQKHDGGIIKKIKINGRSAHFCPVHQR